MPVPPEEMKREAARIFTEDEKYVFTHSGLSEMIQKLKSKGFTPESPPDPQVGYYLLSLITGYGEEYRELRKRIQWLVETLGVPVNDPSDPTKSEPLRRAIAAYNSNIVKYLVSKGAVVTDDTIKYASTRIPEVLDALRERKEEIKREFNRNLALGLAAPRKDGKPRPPQLPAEVVAKIKAFAGKRHKKTARKARRSHTKRRR